MLTEMELTLEQTQQGVSYEISVDPHGFEGIFKDGDGGYQIKKGMSMSVQKSQVHEIAKPTRWKNEIMLG
ncbi:hypothetical protein Tco_0953615 [Tanacetum coccineum]|uniref:Uncharacterized protein n=1 Tax=Tanacetum coccineum TaxID=301880 RepID=A0ABQ5E0E0_9ASTR